jgi:hypothetical protein
LKSFALSGARAKMRTSHQDQAQNLDANSREYKRAARIGRDEKREGANDKQPPGWQ